MKYLTLPMKRQTVPWKAVGKTLRRAGSRSGSLACLAFVEESRCFHYYSDGSNDLPRNW